MREEAPLRALSQPEPDRLATSRMRQRNRLRIAGRRASDNQFQAHIVGAANFDRHPWYGAAQ